MRFTSSVTKKIAKDLTVDDFKEDTVLRMIAEKDVLLAMEVMNYFGGSKEYIPTSVQTCTKAISKVIRRERDQCKSIRLIALELGLTARQINRFNYDDPSLEEPLNDIPE